MTLPPPRVKKRTGNHPYIFKEMVNYTYPTTWSLDAQFVTEWLEISTDGLVTVKANDTGYSWDGCTPKFSLFDIKIVGVPDGHIDSRTMKPYTYRASMVHDALYQYLGSVPVYKRDIDLLFLEMLGDFRLRYLYYFAVKYLGGRGVTQHGVKS
jgi:hypothetical protein